MLLADRHPLTPTIPVSELAQHLTGWNQQTFLRLRMALGMGLRRQVLIAVCDDVALRNALAEKLSNDLPKLYSPNEDHGALGGFMELELGLSARLRTPKPQDRFLSLTLQPSDPKLLGQVFHQLQHESLLGVQILGLEQLTRQPVHIQRAFLNHIRALGRNQLATLERNVVLWVTRPWWRSIQQSAPEFVRWHTGVFEFEGDPAPAGPLNSHPAITDRPSHGDRTVEAVAESSLEAPVASLLREEAVLPPVIPHRMDDPVLTPSDLPDNWPAIAQPALESPTEPPPAAIANHLQPSSEELELADLVLASVMQAATQDPDLEALPTSLEEASAHPHFAPLRILQQVESLQNEQATPEAFSAIYRQLGDWYRDQASQTSQYQSMVLGIKAYGIAGRFLPTHDPAQPDLLNDSGNLYWMLSRSPDRLATSLGDLETAIDYYHQAMDVTDIVAYPQTVAMLQNNLGAAYGDMAMRQQPMENLLKSIAAYQMALKYRTPEVDPGRYAATQNNLGTAFWNLGQHQDLGANLQRAIAAYREALQYYDPESEPLHYAMIQNNLGTAYWNLAQCDLSEAGEGGPEAMPEDLLNLAIGAYRIALLYRTLEASPTAYAATQNNLGTAYWHLANQHGTHSQEIQSCLEQAIQSYEACLAAIQRHQITATFDLAATHNNLASAYHQAATNRHGQIDTSQKSSYLEAALGHYLQAFQGWSSQSEFQDAAFSGLMQTVRSFYECLGLQGQTKALSKIPPQMLPIVMKEL
jgi:tetratricopeptide (TPR) repeat protein